MESVCCQAQSEALLDTLPDGTRARVEQALPDFATPRQPVLDLLHTLHLAVEHRPLLDSLLHRLDPRF